jgi:Ca2+-binding RTX toxin-like protein
VFFGGEGDEAGGERGGAAGQRGFFDQGDAVVNRDECALVRVVHNHHVQGVIKIRGAGNDIVAGSSSSNAGGEIDTLTGGAGADLFILGNAGGRLYDDGVAGSGSSDYALITDFTPGVDLLQLKGVGTSYFLGSSGIPGLAGSGVYFDSNGNGSQDSLDELIAVVQTSTSSPLPNLGAIARFV